MVVFERTAPTSLFDTTYTNTDGYYSNEIETGIYNVIFSKEEYLDEELDDQQLYSDTPLETVTLIGTVNISGYVLLENQNEHSGVQIVFERTEPSVWIDTTYTESNGYFSIDVQAGVYDLNYSKEGFFNWMLYDQIFYNATTLDILTLPERTTLLNVPSVFPTIQFAIDMSNDGDTVLVATGTYYENINFNGHNITLGSNFIITQDTSYLSQTIIDANYSGSVVTFESGEDSTAVLNGLTLKNGYKPNTGGSGASMAGGGVLISYSSPKLSNLIIENNEAYNGGGIYMEFSNSILSNLHIKNNIAIYCGGGIWSNNQQDSYNGYIINSIISYNTAQSKGAGIKCIGKISLDSVIIKYNFTDNAIAIWGNDGGGGFHSWYGNVLLNNVDILFNSVTQNPNSYNFGGGGLNLENTDAILTNVNIIGNISNGSDSNGGGLRFLNSNVSLNNVNISDNTSANGSGIYFSGGNNSIINSIIANNIGNNGIYIESGSPSINYSDIYNNPNDNFYNASQWIGVNVTTNVNGDSVDVYNNIQLDPQISDPDNGDYTLLPTSPCIDAGASFFELEGEILVDMTPDEYFGSAPDMGAFEFDPSTYGNLPPEANNAEYTFDEDYEVTIYLSATDPEEDALTFSIVDMPVNGNLANDGAVVLYTPNTDFNGTDSFTFIANDGEYNSNIATVQLTITPVNDPPVLIDEFEDITIYQYDTETIEIDNFYDVEDDSLAYSVQISDVSIASATVVGEILILTGINSGVAEITVSATDGEYEITDSFDIYVANICNIGDVNCDGQLNVLDIVIAANMVLADEYDEIADMNEDGELNILDLVIMVNLVLYGDAGACIDIDGNVYETVQIGDQLWMAENLKVTHYNNGDSISYPSNEDFGSYSEGQYNDPANADIYGNLYNWAVIDDDKGVCPTGWHVPSDEEFMELEMYLGMSEEEANNTGWRGTDEGSMLAGNSDLWNDGNLENNPVFGTSGLNLLPAGNLHCNGAPTNMGDWGQFWSSSEYDTNDAWYRDLSYYSSNVDRFNYYKCRGMSIRCLGD